MFSVVLGTGVLVFAGVLGAIGRTAVGDSRSNAAYRAARSESAPRVWLDEDGSDGSEDEVFVAPAPRPARRAPSPIVQPHHDAPADTPPPSGIAGFTIPVSPK